MTTASSPVSVRAGVVAAVLALLLLLVLAVPLWLWWSSTQSSASFADSEVLDNNHLGAGTLDIAVGDRSIAFAAENMAPGDVASGQLVLENVGSLPLHYWVRASTSGGPLVEWLSFDVRETTGICRPTVSGTPLASGVSLAGPGAVLLGRVPGTSTGAQRSLAPGESDTLCLIATLPLTAPNSVQGQRLDVDLVVQAEQDTEAQP